MHLLVEEKFPESFIKGLRKSSEALHRETKSMWEWAGLSDGVKYKIFNQDSFWILFLFLKLDFQFVYPPAKNQSPEMWATQH